MAAALLATSYDLGDLKQLSKEEKTFLKKGLKDEKLFPALPTPDEDSWLTVHPESGQSHNSWMNFFQATIPPSRKQKKQIYLVPLGDEWTDSEVKVDERGKKESFLSLLHRFAAIFFSGFQVDVLPSVSIQNLKCKTRMKSGHLQLHIPDVYKYFQSHWPKDAFCVVGITMIDLYPNESYNFVFGQANYRAGVGVFSFARYDPMFYSKKSKSESKASEPCTSSLVLWRSCKVS